MEATPTRKPFNIAIVGGGIAGLTLTISLLERGIPITLYESAPHFGEIGAGVGFESHFTEVMELISPKLKDAFLRVADSSLIDRDIWFHVRVGDESKADEHGIVWHRGKESIRLGENMFAIPSRPGPKGGVHRAHFLDELVKQVPEGVAKFRKRLINVTQAKDGTGDALLHFRDGTTAQHTAVIGCDGIKSRARELVLGKEEARALFSGKYAYRGLLPMEKAREILHQDQPRLMYCGHKGHVLMFPIAKGTIMNVVAFSSRDRWEDSEWVVTASKEEMLSDYDGWVPQVRAVLENMDRPDCWALFNHRPARTYFQLKPRICLLGDAAHASTPHQGAGAGMCIEDCYILGALLAEAASTEDLENAFRAYDAVRRPRSLELVETSREAGRLWDLEGSEGNDLAAFERNATQRMNWIWDHDMAVDLEKARSIFRQPSSIELAF